MFAPSGLYAAAKWGHHSGVERLIEPASAPEALASIAAPDIAVLGSGPGGTVAALELARQGIGVLLIDAGGLELSTDAGPFFEFDTGDHAHQVSYGMSMQLGGSTNLWSGRSARFETGDISTERGWPFDLGALDDAYDRAEKLIGIDTQEGRQAATPGGPWAALLFAPLELKRFVWSHPPRNMADLLRERLPLLPQLTVLLGTRCIGLHCKDGQVTALELKAGDTRRRLTARRFVLAGGGLETPRLMMAEGMDRNLPAIGRYLGTHPKTGVGKLQLRHMVGLRTPLFTDRNLDGQWRRYGIGFCADERPGGLNHYVQLSPRFERLGMSMLDHMQGSLGPVATGSWLRRLPVAAGRTLFDLFGRSGVYQGVATQLSMRGFFDQHPDPENRLRLLPTADPHGLLRAAVTWRLTDADFASIRTFLHRLAGRLEETGIGKVWLDLPASTREWRLTGIHSHFMGTTRMGDNPRDSVTDGTGQVHGQSRLYISGPGLFRTYSYANPVLSIAALAIRVADALAISMQKGR